MQQRAFRAEIHQERVDLAVVVVVGKAGAARDCARAQHRTGIARDIFETVVAQAAKERVFLRDEVNETAMEDEDVEQAVVVEVVDAGSPADILRVGLRDAVGRADVVEGQLALCSASKRL